VFFPPPLCFFFFFQVLFNNFADVLRLQKRIPEDFTIEPNVNFLLG
jgi:hypothetical protein